MHRLRMIITRLAVLLNWRIRFSKGLLLTEILKGWLIPQGTSVTGNLWAIHRNEVDFPEPDQFCPERHLPGHPLCRPFPNEQQRYMTFGWGRRACSGQALAEQGMLLQVARLLWAFQIESVIDGRSGEKIKLDIFDYTSVCSSVKK